MKEASITGWSAAWAVAGAIRIVAARDERPDAKTTKGTEGREGVISKAPFVVFVPFAAFASARRFRLRTAKVATSAIHDGLPVVAHPLAPTPSHPSSTSP